MAVERCEFEKLEGQLKREKQFNRNVCTLPSLKCFKRIDGEARCRDFQFHARGDRPLQAVAQELVDVIDQFHRHRCLLVP